MKQTLLILLILMLFSAKGYGQEESIYVGFGIPAQNAIKYNRFLINPAFSANESGQTYLSLYHRNQSVSYDNNNQSYLLGYSGRAGAQSGAGLSLFNQRTGVIGNTGVLVNYAYGVKFNEKINFTFGANLAYYKSGYDESRAVTGEFDPYLSGLQDGTYLKFQPGFNVSVGAFDFGMMSENLIDFDLKNSNSLSPFSDKIFAAHMQYTHMLSHTTGIMEDGQVRALARGRNNLDGGMTLGGNLLLDLPKLGWIQAGYDSYYGASTGIGFSLSPQLSMGYLMEKNFSGGLNNLGTTHEITFAYQFGPKVYKDREMLEADFTEEVQEPKPIDESQPNATEELEDQMELLRDRLALNDVILGQLTNRSDSLNAHRKEQLNKRFDEAMTTVRQKTGADSFLLKPEKTPQPTALGTKDIEAPPLPSPTTTPAPSVAQDSAKGIAPIRQALADTKAPNTPTSTVQKQLQPEEVKTAPISVAPVKWRRFRNLEGVKEGYYVIANVYKGGIYMQKFISKMEQKGFQADYISNPNNNLKYVYLERFETFKQAESAIKSNFNGNYTGELWVMNVTRDNKQNQARVTANTRTSVDTSYQDAVLRKNVVVRDRIGAENPEEELLKSGAGFYIIANVFKSTKNAARFIRHLNSIGLSANYFINPQNKYRYVYLKRHDNWNSALISYYSNLNNAYTSEMWIMRVTPDLIA